MPNFILQIAYMKILTVLLLTITIAIESSGQKIKFTDTGNVWLYNYSNKDLDIVRYNCYYLDTTITVDTLEYRYFTTKVIYTNSGGTSTQNMLVREDSTGKIFIRSLSGSDTSEKILFDYSLNVGDTVTVVEDFDTFRNFLSSIDSVLIGNVSHRIFNMHRTSNSHSNDYTFIEGIGCTTSPLFPLSPSQPESSTNLFCFTSNGINPTFSKQIDKLNNTTSCHVGISNQHYIKSQIDIYPQPASSVVNIQLPIKIQSGSLAVFNQLGQVVTTTTIVNSELLEIYNPGNLHGLYYYRITDNSENKVHSGKMLFE